MTFNKIDLLLERLQAKPDSRPNQWKAYCPCHTDSDPSLSIGLNEAEGKILLNCFAGCKTEDILNAVNLTLKDLFLNEQSPLDWEKIAIDYYTKQGWTPEAVYRYDHGEYGDGLIKVRYRQPNGDKSFRWMRPNPDNPNGKYILNRNGTKERLYRTNTPLPSATAFLTEGEKDADTLTRLTGIPAYSPPDGATAYWREEYTRQMKGYTNVIISPDNDEAGKSFADMVSQSLQGKCNVLLLNLSDRWTDIPPKGDISDMAKALGEEVTREYLTETLRNVPTERPSTEDEPEPERDTVTIIDPPTPPKLFDYAVNVRRFDSFIESIQTERYKPIPTGFTPFDNALDGGVQPQTLMILTAAPATGKTTFCQQILETAAAYGNDVIYLNLEMSDEQLIAKSLSRWLFQHKQIHYTMTNILKGYQWDGIQRDAVREAAEEYKKTILPHMIYNPIGMTNEYDSLKRITQTALQQALSDGKRAPILCLDYLHLVRIPREEIAETIKATVTLLKDYASRGNTFVIAIAASNRKSNEKGQTMESARDSSNIEYTADYQISLTTNDKDADIRPVNLKIHKARMGKIQETLGIPFEFYAPYNCFVRVE